MSSEDNTNKTEERQEADQTTLIEQTAGSATPTPHVGTYGSFVGYCFGVNYVLGVGVLSIPFAFHAGGVALAPICLFAVSLMAILTMMWVVETLSRTEAWVASNEAEREKEKEAERQQPAIERVGKNNYGTHEELSSSDAFEGQVQEQVTPVAAVEEEERGKQLFQITMRKFEMNEVSYIWLGRVGKIVYEICTTMYLYGSLWSYASVFSQSVASHIPLPVGPGASWFTCDVYRDMGINCTFLYLIYILVFGLIVVPLTCMDLSEQKFLQVMLAIFRFVALGLMIFSIIYSIFVDPYSRSPYPSAKPIEPHGPYLSQFDLFNHAGLYKLLPVALFSQIFHHSLPGLCQPVKNKGHLQHIFSSVFMTTFTFYSFLGITLAMYYGSHTEPTCSLNFTFYRGGAPFGEPVPIWAIIVNFVIVLFPAIDVVSAFPLNGITLGNNIHTAVCMGTKYMNNRKVQILFRLIAAIPPIIGATLVRDLAQILSYVGLVGFVITFIFPPLMHIVSMVKCNKRFGTSRTPYTYSILSHWSLCVPVMLTGLVAIVYCIVTNIMYSGKEIH